MLKCGVQKKNIIVLDIDKWYKVGTLLIKLEKLEHDVKNCCIHIVFENGKKLLYAVDTSTLDNIIAKNYDLYLVEGNYDEEEIEKREEEKRLNGEYVIETRIKNSHLSKQQCDEWLSQNMGDNSEYIYCHEHIEKEIK